MKDIQRQQSYTAASIFPAKLIRRLRACIQNGGIIPYHPQISLTNVCNLTCEFCSCANRANKETMGTLQAQMLMSQLASMGAKAVTVTGGGEPTLHHDFDEIIRTAKILDLQVGLVTNGLTIGNIDYSTLQLLQWMRISVSDDRNLDSLFYGLRRAYIAARGRKDWAFSYVLTAKPNYDKVAAVVEFANRHDFTHVRIVSDLLDLENVPAMEDVKEMLHSRRIDDSLVIYQGRKTPTKGAKRCWISLLKPMFAANGNAYPCCGVQYAMDPPALDFDERMLMGEATSWRSRFLKQEPFDGSNCVRCYYSEYNELLNTALTPLDHEDFV